MWQYHAMGRGAVLSLIAEEMRKQDEDQHSSLSVPVAQATQDQRPDAPATMTGTILSTTPPLPLMDSVLSNHETK